MRGDDEICGRLFSYIDLEQRVRSDHPLRLIRQIVNAALKTLSGEFDKLYSPIGRESIPPERLMRALLVQAFYLIRSEEFVERIDYDLCFAGLLGSVSRIRCGTPQASPRTATGCWRGKWRFSFWRRCCRRTKSSVCCRANTSQSTAHYWKPGRAPRAFSRRTGQANSSRSGAQ